MWKCPSGMTLWRLVQMLDSTEGRPSRHSPSPWSTKVPPQRRQGAFLGSQSSTSLRSLYNGCASRPNTTTIYSFQISLSIGTNTRLVHPSLGMKALTLWSFPIWRPCWLLSLDKFLLSFTASGTPQVDEGVFPLIHSSFPHNWKALLRVLGDAEGNVSNSLG